MSGIPGQDQHVACEWSALEALKLLVNKRAALDAKTVCDQTPLMLACSYNNFDPELVEVLVVAGADIHAIDTEGWTALHFAISQHQCEGNWPQNDEIIKILINHGLDIHQADANGQTPYQMADMHPALQQNIQTWHEAYQIREEQLRLYPVVLKMLWTEREDATTYGLPACEISTLPLEILLKILDLAFGLISKKEQSKIIGQIRTEVFASAELRAHHYESLFAMLAGKNIMLNSLNQVAMQEAWNLYPERYAIVPINALAVSKKSIHPHFSLELSRDETQGLYPEEKRAKVEGHMHITPRKPVRKHPN